MTKERLLEMCKLLDYGITVNENNKNWYDDAIEQGYVEIKKPKRATKFFLTESGIAVVQPVMYLYIYQKYYFIRDNQLSEEDYEKYHKSYPDLNGWDLLIRYHEDKIKEYDGNKTKIPPRTFIYFIAKLYQFSRRPEEAIRYFLVICILDLSGVMEFPTNSGMKNIEDCYKPGNRLYKSFNDIKKKAVLLPGTIIDLKESVEEAGYTDNDIQEIFNNVYSSMNLRYSVHTKEEMIEDILEKVNRG